MKRNLSLRAKLLGLSAGLVLAPVLCIGGYSLYKFDAFAEHSTTASYESLNEQAGKQLETGAQADLEKISHFVGAAEASARRMATSAVVHSFVAAREGRNDLFNNLARGELERIAQGVVGACRSQLATADGESAVTAAQNALSDEITRITVGKSGYVFVMDSKGVLKVHPKSELVGKNVISDLNLTEFREILTNRNADSVDMLSYDFQGRSKCLAYTYVPQWDWVVCVSAYWDDLSAKAARDSLAILEQEIDTFAKASTVDTDTGEQPMYTQVRFINPDGMELFNRTQDGFTSDLGNKSPKDWYKEGVALKAGEVSNSGVVIAENTGKAEMRICSPVVQDGKIKGLLVLNLDWSLAWEQLKDRTYGQTGYAYIVNDQGFAISHPKFTLGDRMDITDPKFGKLATLTREKVLAGQSGVDTYEFEGLYKYCAYRPLHIGNRIYGVCATCPASEFLAAADQMKDDAERMHAAVTWGTGIVATVLAVGGSLVGLLLANSIAKPIGRIIDGLTSGAGQTAAASSQVSAASQSLAQGTSEQAAAIEETTAAFEEMTAMTKQNAESARHANSLMTETQAIMNDGRESMTQLSSAINEIKNSADQTAKIVKTIDEIAFQTNLLALNAAVEAARAGEAGKGFAVVAEEVRNLAQRSAEAARNTAELITQSVKNSDNGVDIANRTASAIEMVTGSAAEVAQLVSQIATASNEQAAGIEMINTAVSQMDQVTQSNAANAEESASAAEELSAQAEMLHSMVDDLSHIVTGSAGAQRSPRSYGHASAEATAGASRQKPSADTAGDKVWHQIARERLPLEEDEKGLQASGKAENGNSFEDFKRF